MARVRGMRIGGGGIGNRFMRRCVGGKLLSVKDHSKDCSVLSRETSFTLFACWGFISEGESLGN